MPVRPRRRRRAGPEWSPRVALALTIGPHPGDRSLDDAKLAAAWERFGPALLATQRPGSRPWGFWRFEPEVPADLRAPRVELVPVGERHRGGNDLDVRQVLWLAENGG